MLVLVKMVFYFLFKMLYILVFMCDIHSFQILMNAQLEAMLVTLKQQRAIIPKEVTNAHVNQDIIRAIVQAVEVLPNFSNLIN